MKFTIQPTDLNADIIVKSNAELLAILKDALRTSNEIHMETTQPLIGRVVFKRIRTDITIGAFPASLRAKLAIASNKPNDVYRLDDNLFLPCGDSYYLIIGEQTVFYAENEPEFELKLI